MIQESGNRYNTHRYQLNDLKIEDYPVDWMGQLTELSCFFYEYLLRDDLYIWPATDASEYVMAE